MCCGCHRKAQGGHWANCFDVTHQKTSVGLSRVKSSPLFQISTVTGQQEACYPWYSLFGISESQNTENHLSHYSFSYLKIKREVNPLQRQMLKAEELTSLEITEKKRLTKICKKSVIFTVCP